MKFQRKGRNGYFLLMTLQRTSTFFIFDLPNFLVQNKVTKEIPLDPLINKTGDVWHVFLEGEIEDMLYGYKFDGKFCPEEGHYFDSSRILLDPYAKVG